MHDGIKEAQKARWIKLGTYQRYERRVPGAWTDGDELEGDYEAEEYETVDSPDENEDEIHDEFYVCSDRRGSIEFLEDQDKEDRFITNRFGDRIPIHVEDHEHRHKSPPTVTNNLDDERSHSDEDDEDDDGNEHYLFATMNPTEDQEKGQTNQED